MTDPRPFFKVNGTGNSFVIVFPDPSETNESLKALSLRLCN
jgi:diaminopimelate epimerase